MALTKVSELNCKTHPPRDHNNSRKTKPQQEAKGHAEHRTGIKHKWYYFQNMHLTMKTAKSHCRAQETAVVPAMARLEVAEPHNMAALSDRDTAAADDDDIPILILT